MKNADPTAEFYSEVTYELGRAYVAIEDSDSAVDIFKKLQKTTKDRTIAAKSLIELGMIARNSSQFELALSYYKQVISEMPDTEYSADALSAIESIYQSEGRGDEYLDYAESVGANKDMTDAEKEQMYFNAAQQVFFTENYTKAMASLQSYMERYPEGKEMAMADYYLAECHRNLGNKEQACDWYRKSLDKDSGSQCAESAILNLARLSYELEHFKDAFSAYSNLFTSARIASNKHTARLGMMRSAFKGQDYQQAIESAANVGEDASSSEADKREAMYVTAKSNLFLGERDEAFGLFNTLASQPSTPEGAEAAFMIVQDVYDQGKYGDVQSKVYKFAEKGGDQPYWLARAFIVLGDSFAEQGNFTQAKATFESIKNGYEPSGSEDDVLDNVNMRLEKLKTLM
ncbi:MAG: tetratricopeptide repeat protein [Bacteroidales bacterium]|nr:tetratricopeptide repeat protein [Bacteroidales bacterium]